MDVNRIKTGRTLVAKSTALALAGALLSTAANAGPRDQVKRMHDRLAGTAPSEAYLDAQAPTVTNEATARTVAMDIIQNSPGFYNVTLKNFAAPWTNRDRSVFVELNDYIATIVGMVRYDHDFRSILYSNVIFTADRNIAGISPYSNSNNSHYQDIEAQGLNLRDDLEERIQSDVTGLPAAATAGVMTTRAAAKSFFIAGTNRAMFRFTLLNHLCRDMEQMHDISRPVDRIRQDVARSPGGDSRIFLTNCVGCHSGMDPMSQAFAYYQYNYDPNTDPEGLNGSISYNNVGQLDPVTGTRVQAKYHINAANFESGFVTPDDRWDNYWRAGPLSNLGWNYRGDTSMGDGSGSGAKSMGEELAHSRLFAQCQVEKVFETVCLRPPVDSNDRDEIDDMMTTFENSNFNLKEVFADAAVYCRGD